MIERVALSEDQAALLHDALENESDGRLLTENTVNLTPLVGFLGTRFLPLPPIQAHTRMQGDERDWDVVLVRASDAYVVFHQLRREGGETFDELSTVSSYLVLNSSLPFALEQRQSGWPLRVRSALLDIVDWTLEQSPRVSDKAAPLWRALRDPQGDPSILAPDTAKLRQVLSGKARVNALWSSWAQDEASAAADFEQCLGMRALVSSLLSSPARPRP